VRYSRCTARWGSTQVDSGRSRPAGLMIRHLVMPNRVAGTRGVRAGGWRNTSPKPTYVNIMAPVPRGLRGVRIPADPPTDFRTEYLEAIAWAQTYGFSNLDPDSIRMRNFYVGGPRKTATRTEWIRSKVRPFHVAGISRTTPEVRRRAKAAGLITPLGMGTPLKGRLNIYRNPLYSGISRSPLAFTAIRGATGRRPGRGPGGPVGQPMPKPVDAVHCRHPVRWKGVSSCHT
jgi:hypothetical protein